MAQIKKPPLPGALVELTGRLPTLPHSCLCSTIGAEELNFRVRDGNGWVLLATVTQKRMTTGRCGGSERYGLRSHLVPREPRGLAYSSCRNIDGLAEKVCVLL